MAALSLAGNEDVRILTRSERLRERRLEMIPVLDGVWTELQGRDWGDGSTAPAALADLISSIGTSGVIQPILCEEVGDQIRVVSGHRRLRACRWGATNVDPPTNYTEIPAVVVPGPLAEEERRAFQLLENLGRVDLQPGELAAALLYERAAVLADRLEAEDLPPPTEIMKLEDPMVRWTSLDGWRIDAAAHHVGAPWKEVIGRLGMEMNEDKAKTLFRAFRQIPTEISAQMDALEISLSTRQDWCRLRRGTTEAADAIWAAVREQDPGLLRRAVLEAEEHPTASPDEAVTAAEAFHEAADQSRAEKQRKPIAVDDAESPVDVTADLTAINDQLKGLVEKASTAGRVTADGYVLGSIRLHLDAIAEAMREEEG